MKLVYQLVVFATIVGLFEATPLGKESLSSTDTNSVTFLLYTLANPSTSQELITGDSSSVTQSNFDPSKLTKIIIHGWTKSAQGIPNPELRSAYLAVGDYNLISVDWQAIAALDYITARYSVSSVGASVADLIDFLNQYAGMSFESVVVIGHSLGAHIAGYAGKYVTRGRLSYIAGLDPAGPLFYYSDPDTRLNSGDADYVETIQTNGGTLGIAEPIGSASYFPNWGKKQPGCGLDLLGDCSHGRVVYLYANSITGTQFTPVYRCPSYNNIKSKSGCSTVVPNLDIGDPTEILLDDGIFYLSTTSAEPYGHA